MTTKKIKKYRTVKAFVIYDNTDVVSASTSKKASMDAYQHLQRKGFNPSMVMGTIQIPLK